MVVQTPMFSAGFSAAPGVITNETLTIQLSNDLAALRPIVSTQVENQTVTTPSGQEGVLLTHHKLSSTGAWDGRTYETDTFDPGSLPEPMPTMLTTKALLGDGTDLKQVSDTLDVQPLPDWYKYLTNTSHIVFSSTPGGQSGSLDGNYTLKGLVINLASNAATTIPATIPFIGGKTVKTAVGFGIIAQIPLSITTTPTVSGYALARVTFIDNPILNKEFDESTQLGGANGVKVTPNFTLDPETLKPNGGFGLIFALTDKNTLYNQGIFSVTRPISIFLATYSVSADVAYALTAQSGVTLAPGAGFVVDPKVTSVDLGVSSTLKGGVDIGWKIPDNWLKYYERQFHVRFPKLFPSPSSLPALVWRNAVSGLLSVDTKVGYSGTAQELMPTVLSADGNFNPQIQTEIVFMIGQTSVLGTDPFNVLPYIFPGIPKGGYKFKFI